MRLNKHISDSGFCSRREADQLIAEARVTVNGVRADLGTQVEAGDEVLVDGRVLRKRVAKAGRKHVYIVLNKPDGITCTTGTRKLPRIPTWLSRRRFRSRAAAWPGRSWASSGSP